jgi:polyhydroxyalkanoate synthesis repressor PhaR
MSQPVQNESGVRPDEQPPVVVKKYANRRLYNTESSSYITLDTLAEMVRIGRDFVVYDAKTGDDITRGVLTQIIVEEESKGRAMLPTGFLRQLIGFYGDSVQTLVPRYLEQAMTSFARQQEQMRVTMQQTMGNFFPFGMEEVGRQNMAMMERAMSLFSPFTRVPDAVEHAQPQSTSSDEVAALRAEVEFLRAQLAHVQTAQHTETKSNTAQISEGSGIKRINMDTGMD